VFLLLEEAQEDGSEFVAIHRSDSKRELFAARPPAGTHLRF
jgi:hypothetical protein